MDEIYLWKLEINKTNKKQRTYETEFLLVFMWENMCPLKDTYLTFLELLQWLIKRLLIKNMYIHDKTPVYEHTTW